MPNPDLDELGLSSYLQALADDVDGGVPERPVAGRALPPRRWRWLAAVAAVVVLVAGFAVLQGDEPASDVDTVGPADTTTSTTAVDDPVDEAALGDPIAGEWLPLEDPIGADDSHATLLWTGEELVGVYPEDGGSDVAIQVWDRDLATVRLAAPSGQVWRAFPTIVWTGDEVLVIGGSNGPGIDDPVLAYDPAADSWRTLSPPPGYDRFPVRGTSVGDDGIWNGEEVLFTSDGLAFDPAADRWRAIASSPYERALAVTGTSAGAFHWGSCPPGTDDDCEANAAAVGRGAVYDASSDSWTSIGPDGGPTPGAAMLAVATGAEVSVVSTRTGRDDAKGNAASFDLRSRTWRPLPDAPAHSEGLSDLVATPLGLAFGGSDRPTVLLEPGGDRWRPLGDDPLAFNRGRMGLAGDRLVVTGLGRTLVFEPSSPAVGAGCAMPTDADRTVGRLVVGSLPDGFVPDGDVEEITDDQPSEAGEITWTQRFVDGDGRAISVLAVNSEDPRSLVADAHRGAPTEDVDIPSCFRGEGGLRESERRVSVSSDDAGVVVGAQTWEYGAFVVRGDASVTRDEVLLVAGGLVE